jgi:hypothetical protein
MKLIVGSGGENRTPIPGFGGPYNAIILHRKETLVPVERIELPISRLQGERIATVLHRHVWRSVGESNSRVHLDRVA